MDVLCLGLMTCDILVKPVDIEIFGRDSSRVDIIKMGSGGDAFNAAVNLAGMGASNAIIKNGRLGCFVRSGGNAFSIPAYVVEAVDTTGAGDAFASGFIAAHLRGMRPEQCARLANAAGALCSMQVGATSWACSFEKIIEWMSTAKTVDRNAFQQSEDPI